MMTSRRHLQVASQLLRERPLRPGAHDLLSDISASAKVLLVLVNNVLLTKKLESGAVSSTAKGTARR